MPATILVVEDEALIADDIQRTLVRLGYRAPDTVATGRACLEAIDSGKPDLVLMDIKLKGSMDGIQTAAKVRERFEVPVIFLTSHSDEATLARAKETRPHGYLIKPFDDRDLRTAIEVALHKHTLEVQLERRERWFSTTLQSIGDAVIATDEQQQITFMNLIAERVTGWKQDDAVGKRVDEVFRVIDARGVPLPSPVGEALRDNIIVELPRDTSLRVRDGGTVAVDDSAAPIIDDRGRVLGGVVVFRDITDKRKLELRLAHSERLASLGTMAAGMAHEINNPLGYVLTNVGYSLERLEEAAALLPTLRGTADQAARGVLLAMRDVADALREAHEGGERIRRIVMDLRKFGRNEPPSLAILDLPDILDVAVKMTENTVRQSAPVVKEYGTTPFVEGDEVQLTQVFVNLLVNAAQAIGEGNADRHRITLRTSTLENGRALVEVSDTGSGIAPEHLSTIFDPFFTTKPVGKGMGLGLALSHSTIVALRGEMTVESTLGRGTTFRVTLPEAGRRAAEQEKPPSTARASRRGKVLIIDDEPALARSLERVLKKEHDVTVVYEGRVALEMLADQEFDIIFCDLMMPSMSGMQVHDAILAARPEQAARMVFMTGGAFSAAGEEFLARVANPTIRKPFALETVRGMTVDYIR